MPRAEPDLAPMTARPVSFTTDTGSVDHQERFTFQQLMRLLSAPTVGPKDGGAWLAGNISPGQRSKARVASVAWLVLDPERQYQARRDANGQLLRDDQNKPLREPTGPHPPPPAEIAEDLRALGWQSCVHTSYSHRPDAPRYRIVFPLSEEIRPQDLKPLSEHVAALLGLSDCYGAPECGNPAGLWFLPRCPQERREQFEFYESEGQPLPVAELLAQARAAAEPQPTRQPPRQGDGSVTAQFNAAHQVGEILERNGYTRKRGHRWLPPDSSSGLAGCLALPPDRVRIFSHNGSDLLNDGKPHDAFDCFRILEHGGSHAQAFRAAEELLGLERELPPLDQFEVPFGPGPAEQSQADPLETMEAHILTQSELDEISEPDFLYEGLVVRSHILAVCAAANAGKTSLMMGRICPSMAKAGASVWYIHADTGGGDAKYWAQLAATGGFKYVTPDLKGKGGVNNVMRICERMTSASSDYADVVLVFDTLKKFTDLMTKRHVKDFFALMRRVTGTGATVILLGHQNKYLGPDGKPIFEGTGDVRNDIDELIYLSGMEDPDGNKVISTNPDKDRAAGVRPLSFRLSSDRTVTALDQFVDVGAINDAAARLEKDRDVLDAIKGAIAHGKRNQSQILQWIKTEWEDISPKRVRRCLRQYSSQAHPMRQFKRVRQFQNNAWSYEIAGSGEEGQTGANR